MSYLLNYNPGTPQYTYPRRGGAQLSGTCIIHTAECAMDLDGDDTSAEVCANFIANRADYGSYHRLVDSDSIINMLPFEYEAWQDSETNNWAVGISAAVQAGKWHSIPAERRDRIYRNMAAAAAEFVQHMAAKGVTVPLRRITGTEARRRVPGFCAHGDSGISRSDPGAHFDWELFFNYTAQALGGTLTYQSTPDQEDGFLMALNDEAQNNIYAAVGRIDQWITGGGPNAAVLDALDDPDVLDRIALAVLKRDCHNIGPDGSIQGTTTLARKINWMAHNDQAILSAIVDVSKKLDVAHPVLPAEATITEDVA